jgi:hypothetical protein
MFDDPRKQPEREPEPEANELPEELAALERRLAEFVPPTPRLDRDRLMFAAGSAAAEGGACDSLALADTSHANQSQSKRWFWPAATATMTAASVVLAAVLAWQLRSNTDGPVVVATRNIVKPSADRHTADTNARLDEVAIAPSSLPPVSGWPRAKGPTTGYLAERRIAITRGVDALGRNQYSSGGSVGTIDDASWSEPATVRELLEELLPEAAQPQARS